MKSRFNTQNDPLPYILFRIKDNFFTISCEYVSDMQSTPETVTPLPKTPAFVCGTFQSYGRVITLLDLQMLLGFCNVPEKVSHKTVIILKNSPFKGFLVDEIISVVPVDNIAPVDIQSFNNSFINGAFNVFFKKTFIYGVDARCNAGYGLWQLAFGSTGEADMPTAKMFSSAGGTDTPTAETPKSPNEANATAATRETAVSPAKASAAKK